MSAPTLAPNGGGAVAPSSQGTALIPRDEHDAIVAGLQRQLAESIHCPVLQAVLDAIAGTIDTSSEIADHPNVKFAQMRRLELTSKNDELRAELAEARKWRLAAALTGLYPSDTDISTPELWQTAQSEAACQLLSQRDAAQARVRELEQMDQSDFMLMRKCADEWKNKAMEWSRENATLRAQVAQLEGALGALLLGIMDECRDKHQADPVNDDPPWEKDYGMEVTLSVGEIQSAHTALASDGSELLDAVREARDALALVYCDGCGSEAFPFRAGDHADASWGVRFTAVKTALANLNSAIGGEVSHE